MEDIMKRVKSLEDSGLLLKAVSEAIQNLKKWQKGEFLSMLLVRLCVSLLGIMLSGKGKNRAGDGIVRVGYESKWSIKKFLIPPHPLTNLEIQRVYQNKPIFKYILSEHILEIIHLGK